MTDPYDPANRPPPKLDKRPQTGPASGYEPPPGYGPPSGYDQQPPSYGAPAGYQGQPPPGGYGAQKKNGFGVAALVLGVLSLVFFWTGIGGLVFGGLALAFGILGRRRVSRQQADNGGVALAGLITGALGLLLGLVIVIVAIVVFARGDFSSLTECSNAATTQADLDQCAQDFGNSFSN